MMRMIFPWYDAILQPFRCENQPKNVSFDEIETILNKIKMNQQRIKTSNWTVSNCDDDLANLPQFQFLQMQKYKQNAMHVWP